MTEKELKETLKYLAKKYIADSCKREAICEDVDRFGADGAKGILKDITKHSSCIEPSDAGKIKEIVYYFC